MNVSKLSLILMFAVSLFVVDTFAGKPVPCPKGTYSKAGAKSVKDCLSCSTEGPGAYSDKEGTSVCSYCPTGQVANATATGCMKSCKKSEYLTQSGCVACPSGWICDGTSNVECKDGFFKKSEQGVSVCIYCGSHIRKCAGLGQDVVCEDGYFVRKGRCTACPKYSKNCTNEGFVCEAGYQMVHGQLCEPCDNGYYCPEGTVGKD